MTVNARKPTDPKPQGAATSSADLSTASFEVSRASPDEWPVARAARLAALVAEPERFGVSFLSEETRTADEWRQQLTQQLWFFARQRSDSAVAGLAVFYPDDLFPDGAPQLGSMWVDPAYRRRGVAEALAAAVEDAACRSGADALGLWVTVGNDQARDVYTRLGYVLTGATKPAPRDPALQMHRMIKRITPRRQPWAIRDIPW
jgi:ribosomal protein S18 acetylase RimI-like enzyme